jgi:hypothetical protein
VRGSRYWINQGPITKDEVRRAQEFFKKKGKPFDRNSEAFRNFVSRLRKRREINRYLKGKEPSAADPSAPWQVIYGDRVVGGAITFIHSSGPSANDPDKYLHVIITLACHEINLIKAVYFDGYQLSWDTDLLTRPTGQVNAQGIFDGLVIMQINYGSDGQSALSVPVGQTTGHNPVGAKWTSTDRQRGHAHVYLRLTNNENVFKNGTPEITFAVSGKYNVVDPRTGTNAPGAANAAMVLYDYMTNTRFGLGLPSSAFNTSRLHQAIDDCENLIPLAGGGNEYRYLVDCLITTDESPGAVIEQILASMCGHMVYSEGKWSIYAGKPRTPVMTIDEDMILSNVRLLTKTPRIDNFNTVRATYVSDANGYEETDAPEVRNTAYIAEDSGVVVPEDLTYQYVTSGSRVQRLMKIELNEARQGRFVEFTARLAAYRIEAGEWFQMDFERFGWTGQTFRLVRTRLQSEASDDGPPLWTVKITAKAVENATFDWLAEESPADQYPDTNLPNPFVVQPPSAVTLASGTDHLYVRADGTVFSRLHVSWTAAPDSFVLNGGYYEVQYFAAEVMTDWLPFTDVPGSSTSLYILDVLDEVGYQVRVRSVNGLGARSAWATSGVHVVVGKTAAPSDVPSFSVVVEGFGLKFSWLPVTDPDVREYEIRYGPASQAWANAAVLARVRADRYFAEKLAAGAFRFRIKAVDTSGNYSTNEATADLTVSAPSVPRNVSVSQIDNNVLIRWDPPATTVFPIAYYKVNRQTATTLTEVGRVSGTFSTYVELLNGSYIYRVNAVDVAGNESEAGIVYANVYSPPDFVLRSTASGDLSTATLTNAAYEASNFSIEASANTEETWEDHFLNNGFETFQDFIDDGYTYYLEPLTGTTGTETFTTTEPSVWMPFDTAQTWESHFTSMGFATFQDFIDAGYTYYLQPNGLLSGTVEVVVDMAEVLPQTIVNFDYVAFGSGIQPVPTVAWRETPSDPWTSGQEGERRVTPSSYRYLKLTLAYEPLTELDWCVVTDVTVNVQVKEITDSGTVAVNAGDVGGTTVTFNKQFLDVSSIVCTPQGTTELRWVRDFTDTVNPTNFKILLFNSSGARASGTVSWTARGVQAVL